MSNALEIEKLPLTSENVLGKRIDALQSLFPEVFTEGKVDFERLRAALGDSVETSRERYGLSWAGKSEAVRAVQTPSTGTLQPMPDESINFDTSENLIIEGDNLEVLKLLQKSYYGKVKMIYIDPPYNTGNDFIYPDNFNEGLADYLKYSGQVDKEGSKQTTNIDSAGRFHSKWLRMMYPRLFLARNLLKEDGTIFVSLDDGELHTLRATMDEIFGEENFIANVIWQKVYAPKNTAMYFSEDHDHILVYARNAEVWRPKLLPRSQEANARYSNPDGDPRGDWKPSDLTARNYYSRGMYEVTGPTGKVFKPGMGRYWRLSHKNFLQMDEENRIWWGTNTDSMPQQKRFLSEVQQGIIPQTLWAYKDVGHTQEAKKELLSFVDFEHTDNVLNTVKPSRLIQRMLQISTDAESDDIVLDFFAGGGSTAHGVLVQNETDKGNRKFILVQLPHPLPIPEPKLKTVVDITTERVSNVIRYLKDRNEGKLEFAESNVMDRGFKSFRLTSSNFQVWNPSEVGNGSATLAQQLELFAEHVKPDRSQQDILFELILKAGLPLTAKIEALEVAGQTAYSVEDKELVICLENPVTYECLHGIIALEPERVICLDSAFLGNDKLKTNVVLEMQSHDVIFRTV